MWDLKSYQIKSDEEYNDSTNISYSLLKDINLFPNILIERQQKRETLYLKKGSLLDVLLLSPNEINKNFIISDEKEPHFNIIIDIFNILIEQNETNLKKVDPKYLLELYDQLGSSVKWKEETKLDNLFKYERYYKLLKKSKKNTLTIINKDFYQDNVLIAEQIKNHPKLQSIFAKVGTKQAISQFKIFYNFKDLPCKSKLDLIIIDDKKKIIYPYDLKTSSKDIHGFWENYVKYRYDLQHCLYSIGLQEFLKETPYKDYTVYPFVFIFVSLLSLDFPLIVKVNEEAHQRALHGWTYKYKKLPGLFELIYKVKWQLDRSAKVNKLYSKELVTKNSLCIDDLLKFY